MRTLPRITFVAMLLAASSFVLAAACNSRNVAPQGGASAPFYPLLAVQAAIEGLVTLRVSRMAKRVWTVDAESRPSCMVRVTKRNVSTWPVRAATLLPVAIRGHSKRNQSLDGRLHREER